MACHHKPGGYVREVGRCKPGPADRAVAPEPTPWAKTNQLQASWAEWLRKPDLKSHSL